MKIGDLSKQLNIKNKELIDFYKSKDYKVSSHMQNVTDEMYDLAVDYFSNATYDAAEEAVIEDKPRVVETPVMPTKTYALTDLIPCRSVCPYKLNTVGVDRTTVYHWSGYGDVDYVSYRDLQSMRRKDIITKPKIIIEDPDLCYQWRRELGDTYKHFLDVEYPEEFFDLSDESFKRLLLTAPDVVKDVIRITAMNMIKNENYPTVQKVRIIDDVLGSCLKDFL